MPLISWNRNSWRTSTNFLGEWLASRPPCFRTQFICYDNLQTPSRVHIEPSQSSQYSLVFSIISCGPISFTRACPRPFFLFCSESRLLSNRIFLHFHSWCITLCISFVTHHICSGVMSAMSSMVNLEVPWINIMTKMDLVTGKADDPKAGRNGIRRRRNIARCERRLRNWFFEEKSR